MAKKTLKIDLKPVEIDLKPVINKSNKQINFYLKKKFLPKEICDKLPQLKYIRLDLKSLEFEKEFEKKWNE